MAKNLKDQYIKEEKELQAEIKKRQEKKAKKSRRGAEKAS